MLQLVFLRAWDLYRRILHHQFVVKLAVEKLQRSADWQACQNLRKGWASMAAEVWVAEAKSAM